jgi:Tol biopolymer transport system component
VVATLAALSMAASGQNQDIVFYSNRAGNYDIWRMHADGTGLTQLTTDPGNETLPLPSPNGQLIAYTRDTGSGYQARLMNADGTNDRLIKQFASGVGGYPVAWVPEGDALIINHNPHPNQRFERLALDGTQTPFLDPAVVGQGSLSLARFTPDGSKLAFSAQAGSWSPTMEIYLANYTAGAVVTSGIQRLTNNSEHDNWFAFSPDGSQIGFSKGVNGAGHEPPTNLYTMNSDGSGTPVQIDGAFYNAYCSDWSPAAKILFAGQPTSAEPSNIHVMNPDGSGVTKLTSGAYDDGGARWLPADLPPPPNEVGTLRLLAGGTLNGRPVDPEHDMIIVGPGVSIRGSIRVSAENRMGSNAVAPLGGTADWGDRATAHWQAQGWIATGTNTYDITVNKIAPMASGIYHIVCSFAGEFTTAQVFSCTNWSALPGQGVTWNDGNDVAFDWGSQEFTAARQDGAVLTQVQYPAGTGYLSSYRPAAVVTVKVVSDDIPLEWPAASPIDLACRDFNGDGVLDIVSSSYQGAKVELLLGDGQGRFVPGVGSAVAPTPNFIAAGDLDHDGRLDLVTSSYSTGKISILLNRITPGTNSGSWARQDLTLGGQPSGVFVADVTGDGFQDLVVGDNESVNVKLLRGSANGTLGAAEILQSTNDANSHEWFLFEDFDKDGIKDLLIGEHRYGDTVTLYRGRTDGTISPAESFPATNQVADMASVDLNGDGYLDVVVTGVYPQGQLCVLHWNPSQNGFVAPVNFNVSGRPYALAVADFNKDGHPDAVSAPFDGPTTLQHFAGNTTGGFDSTPTVLMNLNSDIYEIDTADLNGDTWPDLIVALATSNKIQILLGTPQGFVTGAQRDTDGDGQFDATDDDDDNDGVADTAEAAAGTNPLLADTDEDGLSDPDETTLGTNPVEPDSDGDGLADGVEVNRHGTSPLLADTDGDGFNDKFEIEKGKDPRSAADSPEGDPQLVTAVEFRFNGALGRTYRIESSTDLKAWTPVEVGVVGTGGTISRLYSIQGLPKRYFRATRE